MPHHDQHPLVTVIIPTYNGASFLAETIDSVLAQSYRNTEVLVVDDGSTDETPGIVAAYGARVRHVRQTNAGTAAARNAGIREAKGEFIALLDHDDLWFPNKLERQIPRFLSDASVGLVYAGIEFFDTESGRVTASYFPAEELDVHDLLGHQVLPIQTVIFRRSVLDQVGPFDIGLKGTDDWDMGIRVAAQSRLVGVRATLARVRLHQSQQGRNIEQMFHHAMRVVDKHQNIHSGCDACRRAVRTSRFVLREDYYGNIKGRAVSAWASGKYVRAAVQAIWAFWQHPPALRRVLGRSLRGQQA